MGRLIFFFQEALRALRRNGAPTLAAIVTTVVTVILLGVLIPIFQTTQAKSEQVRDQLNFQIEIFPDATKSEIAAAKSDIEAVPHVETVEFVSKTQALQELKDTLGKEKSRELTSQLHENPLPQSFRVVPDDAAYLNSVRATVSGADGKPFAPVLGEDFSRQDAQQQIEQVTSALKIVLTVITVLLILASLMLVGNTIRLSIYTRRREVEVMRLVGATRWFIRWPFMIEGVVVGFAGGLLAILILCVGKITIVDPLSDSFTFLKAQNDTTLAFPELVAILFAAAVIVSTIGSGVTLRRFLRV
jgi:cell division transport system permease protein